MDATNATNAAARRKTLDAVRAAFADLTGDEAEAVAEMLLRAHGGREVMVFPHPQKNRPAHSLDDVPDAMTTCVARFGRLRHADVRGGNVAYVERIET